MNTQNNIEQTIEQASSEFMERIKKTGGYAIVMASHEDIETACASLYGSGRHLVNLVISVAKGNKDLLNTLNIALSLMEDDQTTEAPEAKVLPTTTIPS